MLGGLPGSDSSTPITAPENAVADPTTIPPEKLVIELPDGTKQLQARTVRHVMIHVFNTVKENDAKLFWDEVLCEQTREEFAARGMGPDEAMAMLRARETDLAALFNSMPMGESTPGTFIRPVGGGVQRLELTGMAARGLNWTGIDFTTERGSYRLRWFCGPKP